MSLSPLRAFMVICAISAAFTTACDDAGDDSAPATAVPATQAREVLAQYARIVHATYVDTHQAARDLASAVAAFVADPTETTLAAARDAWLASREPYLQSEVFRFYDGPIDHPDHGPEGMLNAWPLDEAYVDSVAGDPAAGIINADHEISAERLMALNEQGGETNIATGYHAIEFLLWGQDEDPNGPGDRPASDFLDGDDATLPNGARRRQYLSVATDLLVGQLEALESAWRPDAENYRRDFLAATPEEGLRRVLTGMIILSGFETGGERLQTALDTGDQEDEHSCFSDNTHRDMVQDIRGVQNVYLGRYVRLDGSVVEGVGLAAVVEAVDPALATRLGAEIADSLAKAEALQPPFDREIAADNPEGRARVAALVTALRTQEKTLQAVFRAFDLDIPVVE